MPLRILRVPLVLALAALTAAVASQACSAGEKSELSGTTGDGGGNATNVGGSGNVGSGGSFSVGVSNGGNGGGGGVFMNPCGTECGDTELCDAAAVALDDNCNGEVDEGCSCTAGTAQACFKGDPSYINDPGCAPGTQKCTELGVWGPCVCGQHATEMCFSTDQTGCHAINTAPFVPIDLKTGTGTFSMDAVTESWTVACPPGVNPCPTPQGSNPMDDYTPLQSGEYTVTYNKTTANGMDSCTYPLYVGAPGLRVELQWEWDTNLGPQTVDLDLHMKKPMDMTPWGGDQGSATDCAYDNCTADAFLFSFGNPPTWFNGSMPPQPVNWWLDPVFEKNTCYFGPKGNGADWQSIGMGCHNPRLDIDNISCTPGITDPQNLSFCNPENINIDYPPKDAWTRVGVHYYSSHSQSYNVHPVVKIFCHGKLAAELGPTGFASPVTFTPADSDVTFWLVADVAFVDDVCNDTICVVEPLFSDTAMTQPLKTQTSLVQQSYGPPYPPLPSMP